MKWLCHPPVYHYNRRNKSELDKHWPDITHETTSWHGWEEGAFKLFFGQVQGSNLSIANVDKCDQLYQNVHKVILYPNISKTVDDNHALRCMHYNCTPYFVHRNVRNLKEGGGDPWQTHCWLTFTMEIHRNKIRKSWAEYTSMCQHSPIKHFKAFNHITLSPKLVCSELQRCIWCKILGSVRSGRERQRHRASKMQITPWRSASIHTIYPPVHPICAY